MLKKVAYSKYGYYPAATATLNFLRVSAYRSLAPQHTPNNDLLLVYIISVENLHI
jgi:hypothetical protein